MSGRRRSPAWHALRRYYLIQDRKDWVCRPGSSDAQTERWCDAEATSLADLAASTPGCTIRGLLHRMVVIAEREAGNWNLLAEERDLMAAVRDEAMAHLAPGIPPLRATASDQP
jgi:hypothetical protein